MVDTADSRKLARTFALATIGLVALFWAGVLIATWNLPHALFGWNLGADGKTLIYVSPHGRAAAAGLRAGDRIDWASLPLVGRANLGIVEGVDPATKLHVQVTRGSTTRSIVIAPARWPKLFERASRFLTVAGLFLLVIGIALVHLRPTRMTWGFLFSSLFWAYPSAISWLWAQRSSANFLLGDGLLSLLTGAYAAGILIFMSRFPSDAPRGPLRLLDRFAIPLGIAVAALGLYVDAVIVLSASPPPAWALFVTQSLVEIVLFVLALGALIMSYALTQSSDRQRIIPVLLAFAAYVAFTLGQKLYSAFYTNPAVSGSFYFLTAVSMIALAAAVAHGVIRHRVFDVSFAISRTVVYTILTTIVVGAFALIDFVSSKLLERLQIALVLETVTALAFGIWLNVLHSRIDQFVDRVMFRRRHLAESRLNRTARTLHHAESPSFIEDTLVLEVCDVLALASAAVFRRDGEERFVRVASQGWGDEHSRVLSCDERLAVMLCAELQPLHLSDVRWPQAGLPGGLEQPILAVPLAIRHELLGFTLYGGHLGGEAIDPDEQVLLVALAEAAADAYEHLDTKALSAQAGELRTENAMLRREESLLREMLETLGGATRSIER